MKLNNKTNKGFTIIEVLIVLAIAGVIMGIVFLAVPNLQRNSRNTQMRTDANNLLGIIREYSTNNNGTMPTWVRYDSTGGFVNLGTGTAVAATSSANLGRIRAGLATVTEGTTHPTATQTFTVALNTRCNGNTLPATVGTSARATAVVFVVETATGTTQACQEG